MSDTTLVDPEDMTKYGIKLLGPKKTWEPVVVVAEETDVKARYDQKHNIPGIVVIFREWVDRGLDLSKVPIIHLLYCNSARDAPALSKALGIPVVGVEGAIRYDGKKIEIVEGPSLEKLSVLPPEEAENRVVEFSGDEKKKAAADAPLRKMILGEAGSTATQGGAGGR